MREFELPKSFRIAASIAALAGLSAIACERPPSRVFSTPVAQPTSTPPARRAEVATQLTLEQQAQEFAIDRLLNVTFKQDKTDGQVGSGREGTRYLNTSIIRQGEVGGRPIDGYNLIKGSLPENQNYLTVQWRMDGMSIYTGWGSIWGAALGEVQMRGLRTSIKKIDSLSTADSANGIGWRGEVEVHSIRKMRLMIIKGTVDNLPDSPSNDPSPQWTDYYINVPVTLLNGKWVRTNDNPSAFFYPFNEMRNILPVGGFAYVNNCPCSFNK